jgi:hypothetical protein
MFEQEPSKCEGMEKMGTEDTHFLNERREEDH